MVKGLFLATPPSRAVERGASSERFLGNLTGVSKEEVRSKFSVDFSSQHPNTHSFT